MMATEHYFYVGEKNENKQLEKTKLGQQMWWHFFSSSLLGNIIECSTCHTLHLEKEINY